MKRISVPPRPNWQAIAEQNGFFFHHVHGELYWDESVCYAFTLPEIEQGLEDPAQELAHMCRDLAADIVNSEELLEKLAIPRDLWDVVRDSWVRNEPSLYGRFDFVFDGENPAKLYEYNADTPTALYEASCFQWVWLEDAIKSGILPPGVDQFNSIHEKLVNRFGDFGVAERMHFASMRGSEEDRATVAYLADCARQGGVDTKQIFMEDIGIDAGGQFVDTDNEAIRWLFKLYPWEYVWGEEYAARLLHSDTTFIEPPWKMVLSNKGILPLLWERYAGHPNLLPAWFHDETQAALTDDYVLKPLLSREGGNVQVFKDRQLIYAAEGEYGAEGYIGQQLALPPYIDGFAPICGVWIVGDQSCGLGIREDSSPITTNLDRFVPHYITSE